MFQRRSGGDVCRRGSARRGLDGLRGRGLAGGRRRRLGLSGRRCLRRWRWLCGRRGCDRRRRGGRAARDGGGWRRRRGRRRRRSCRKQRHGIDVAVLVVRRTNAEVHVRHVELRRSAWPDRADGGGLVEARARPKCKRAQVSERDRVPVLCPDAERQAVSGRRARERDDACRGCENGRALRPADVDAAVLSGGIRMSPVEREHPQDRAVRRPGPRRSACGQGNHEHDQSHDEEPQKATSLLSVL